MPCNPTDRPCAPLRFLVALATALLASSVAHANWGLVSRMQSPPVDERTLELFETSLRPTEEQLDLARELAATSGDEFERLARAWSVIRAGYEREQEKTQEFSFEALYDLFDRAREFNGARTKIRERFYADLGVLLDQQQAAKWERFRLRVEREEFYRVALPDTIALKPYTVDIESLLESLDPPADLSSEARSAIDAIFDVYALGVGAALADLEPLIAEDARTMRDISQIMTEAVQLEAPQREGFVAMLTEANDRLGEGRERVGALGGRLAGLHERYLRLVAAETPGPDAERLRDAYLRAAFPRLYRETDAQGFLVAALDLDALAPDQRERIEALSLRLDRELSPPRDTIREETLRSVPVDALVGSRYPTIRKTPEQLDAETALRELDDRYTEALARVLNDEQRFMVLGEAFTDWRGVPLEP